MKKKGGKKITSSSLSSLQSFKSLLFSMSHSLFIPIPVPSPVTLVCYTSLRQGSTGNISRVTSLKLVEIFYYYDYYYYRHVTHTDA